MEGFDYAYQRLLDRLVSSGQFVQAHNEGVANDLREVFNKLSSGECDEGGRERDGSQLPAHPSSQDGGPASIESQPDEVPAVMESESEKILLKSLEVLGSSHQKKGHISEAYTCYKIAHTIYSSRLDRRHVKTRQLVRKMMWVLLLSGRYERILAEHKDDAQLDAYGTLIESETTLFIKVAFGRSLVTTGKKLEAVPYLTQGRLGEMNFHKRANVDVLQSVFTIVLEQLAGDSVDFAMRVSEGVLHSFVGRIRNNDCPSVVFEFAFNFCTKLRDKNCMEQFHRINNTAVGLHSSIANGDSFLLASVIGCSFPKDTAEFRKNMNNICVLQSQLLRKANKDDRFTLARLEVATRIVNTSEVWERAVKILLDTFNHVSNFLSEDDPYHKCFHELLIGRLYYPD